MVLSGPTINHNEGWRRIKESGLIMDDQTEPGLYLGCTRNFKSVSIRKRDKKGVYKDVSIKYVELDPNVS